MEAEKSLCPFWLLSFQSPLPASAKPAVPSLFGDDDEDDLFASSSKPKAPPVSKLSLLVTVHTLGEDRPHDCITQMSY